MRLHDVKEDVAKKFAEYKVVGEQLCRARNPFELRYFVIGKHGDRIQQYKQAVVEMDAKYGALNDAYINLRKNDVKRRRLLKQIDESEDELEKEDKMLDLERIDFDDKQTKIAMFGAFKEVMDFIAIIEAEFSDLVDKTEEELLVHEVDYWKSRFAKQVQVDILTEGKIGAGNLLSLLSMPKDIQQQILIESGMRTEEWKRLDESASKALMLKLSESYPHKTQFLAGPAYQPLKLRKDAPHGYPEDRVVNIDRAELMIATLHRPDDKVWLSDSFVVPTGKNFIKHWVTCDNPEMIGEWRNRIVMDALSLGCTHLFFVDDDLEVDQNALMELYKHNLDIVGGWYPKKTSVIESASMIKGDNTCDPVPSDSTGLVKIDWALTAGLTLIKMDVFRKMQYPWFMTRWDATEDTYFTQRAIENGYDVWLDTSVKAAHVDKATGKKYSL